MSVRGWLAEVYRRDRVLALAGWSHLALLALMLSVAPFDSRTVMGLNPWIKPLKFAVSDTAYLWTLAWLLPHAPGPRWAHRTVSWGASMAMIAEILCISLQAARGTTSHYNFSTPFNAAVFSLMGVMILLNTLVALLFLVLSCLSGTELPRAYLWGVRLGALLFILGSLEGTVMIAQRAHTVGLPDGGPGLPLLNWSTKAGDLRAAHLVGLHSLQILPIVGYLLSRRREGLSGAAQLGILALFALIYSAAGALLFRMALSGRSLIAL